MTFDRHELYEIRYALNEHIDGLNEIINAKDLRTAYAMDCLQSSAKALVKVEEELFGPAEDYSRPVHHG